MTLQELQRAFARRILAGDPSIFQELRDSDRTDRETLMHVYEHGYGARMAEVLEGDYEKLSAALGQAAFQEMAGAYLAAVPSRHPNAQMFGARLPAFLATAAPWAATPWLAELAAVEWAMGEVFLSPDSQALGIEAMAALHPQDWPLLRFQTANHVRRIDARSGGPEAWMALAAHEDPAGAAAKALPGAWLFWRQDYEAVFRPMPPEEAIAFDLTANGAEFADVCEALLGQTDAGQAATLAAGFLKNWIEAGLIAGYQASEAI